MGYDSSLDRSADRDRMLREQLVARGIHDDRVLAAMREVPRERFLPDGDAAHAYDDRPLPLAHGQTISQPYIVAATLQAARIGAEDTVLDVGTGSGYAAAVLARLAKRVVSIERIPELSERAAAVLAALNVTAVECIVGDGANGAAGCGPFDAIVCAAATRMIPEAWEAQLAPGGRIVAPVGGSEGQRLISIRIDGDGSRTETDLGGVVFVRLISDEKEPNSHDGG